MGTSDSYSGSGGNVGRVIRYELEQWLDELPLSPPINDPHTSGPEAATDQPPVDQHLLTAAQAVLPLLRPRSTAGSGGGGTGGVTSGGGRGGGEAGGGRRSGGGPRRSAASYAGSAGRAAAAAYAFQTGDAAALERLGLRYDELRALGDPLDVVSRIVAAACGPISESTIEDIEQRYIAAQLAEWVFDQGPQAVPSPEDMTREAISLIIFETLQTETGDLIRRGQRPAWVSEVSERDIREAAEVIAQRAQLSVDGVTEAEFTNAIENGIETLRQILGGM